MRMTFFESGACRCGIHCKVCRSLSTHGREFRATMAHDWKIEDIDFECPHGLKWDYGILLEQSEQEGGQRNQREIETKLAEERRKERETVRRRKLDVLAGNAKLTNKGDTFFAAKRLRPHPDRAFLPEWQCVSLGDECGFFEKKCCGGRITKLEQRYCTAGMNGGKIVARQCSVCAQYKRKQQSDAREGQK